VYIIVDHGRNRIKPLVWGRSGYVIWYKRLEEGTFELPEFAEGGQILRSNGTMDITCSGKFFWGRNCGG
jgi:transposase